MLFDLLTRDEELSRANAFDIELLAGRLIEVTDWLTEYQTWPGRPIRLLWGVNRSGGGTAGRC